MSPLTYTTAGWVAPWTPGLEQRRCRGRLCVGEGLPGLLVVAITLDDDGLCASCARTAGSDDAYQLGADPALDALIAREDSMIDRPDTIIDAEREEAQVARHHEQPGEPGHWTGERWVDRPTRAEAENDER